MSSQHVKKKPFAPGIKRWNDMKPDIACTQMRLLGFVSGLNLRNQKDIQAQLNIHGNPAETEDVWDCCFSLVFDSFIQLLTVLQKAPRFAGMALLGIYFVFLLFSAILTHEFAWIFEAFWSWQPNNLPSRNQTWLDKPALADELLILPANLSWFYSKPCLISRGGLKIGSPPAVVNPAYSTVFCLHVWWLNSHAWWFNHFWDKPWQTLVIPGISSSHCPSYHLIPQLTQARVASHASQALLMDTTKPCHLHKCYAKSTHIQYLISPASVFSTGWRNLNLTVGLTLWNGIQCVLQYVFFALTLAGK